MNIGKKYYDDPAYQDAMSRADVLILGFYPGWRGKAKESMRMIVQEIKRRNPTILIGQYTNLNETFDAFDSRYADKDKSQKVEQENWWIRDGSGKRVRHQNARPIWDINITHWVQADDKGMRFPEWLAERNYKLYFEPIPEFDIWYFDITVSKPPVKWADWDLDGLDDSSLDPRIAAAYREGHAAEWGHVKKLRPEMYLMGNTDDLSSSQYSGKLQGAFLEALIGKSWSMERWQGWDGMMRRYRDTMKHTSAPNLVGFNVWGRTDDYKRMRYGLASCLLDDGYFSYTDEDVGYSSVAWFDEYDVELGAALDDPPLKPWKNQVYRRRFENGMVLVNPTSFGRTVRIEPGYRHIRGKQDPSVNNGQGEEVITLKAKDGLILLRDRY